MFDWLLGLGLSPGNKDAYLLRYFTLWLVVVLDALLLGWTWVATAWKR